MKRLLYILISFLPLGMSAQNMYEIAPLMQNELTGTSRYISMGGSMGALGADVSVMGSNPAGIGLYRSSDFAITGSMGFYNTNAVYNGNATKSKGTVFDVENFGAVLANKVNNAGSLKFLNFGIGYRRTNNFSGEFAMAGPSNGYSQQYAIRDLYDMKPFELKDADYKAFEGFYYSWLPLLATYANIGDKDDNLITKPDGSLIYEPTDVEYTSEKRGGTMEVDFNFAANINDRFYFGATLSLVNVDYSVNSVYYEYDEEGTIYSIGNSNKMEGTGCNIKLGAILRPFKYFPFKLGVAVHTPTWYNIRNLYYADIWGPADEDYYDTRNEDLYYDILETRSRFFTPWRFIASASYTFDAIMAFNVDYEFADYSSAGYTSLDAGSKSVQNEEISLNLRGQHNIRAGVEFNVGAGISLRAGYNYSTAMFNGGAYKDMITVPCTTTSTEYENIFETEAVTLGGGYRGKVFYFDMAYVLSSRKSDFYTYYDPSSEEPSPAASVDQTNHTITATFGLRF